MVRWTAFSRGPFLFGAPPAGHYTLVVRDPAYQGEMTFTSNGCAAAPLELPIATRELAKTVDP